MLGIRMRNCSGASTGPRGTELFTLAASDFTVYCYSQDSVYIKYPLLHFSCYFFCTYFVHYHTVVALVKHFCKTRDYMNLAVMNKWGEVLDGEVKSWSYSSGYKKILNAECMREYSTVVKWFVHLFLCMIKRMVTKDWQKACIIILYKKKGTWESVWQNSSNELQERQGGFSKAEKDCSKCLD